MPIDYDGVPKVTYCHPEVASVGITEAKAKEMYGADKVVALKYSLAGNGKSKILKTAGEIKLVQVKEVPWSASTWSATAGQTGSAKPS